MAISPPFTAAKAVLVCSRSTDPQCNESLRSTSPPPETAGKDETPLGLRSVKKQIPINDLGRGARVRPRRSLVDGTRAELAPLMAPLPPP